MWKGSLDVVYLFDKQGKGYDRKTKLEISYAENSAFVGKIMNFSRSTKLLPLNTDRLPLYINVLLTTKRY